GEPGPVRLGFRGEAGLSGDGNGLSRGGVSVRGGSERVRYSGAVATAFTRGIYELPHDLRTNEASARIDVLPDSRWELTATGRVMDVSSKLPVRDPGATRVPQDPNARSDRRRIIATAGARFTASERWEHRLRAGVYRQDFLYQDRRDDVLAEIAMPPPYFVADFNLDFDSDFTRPTLEYSGAAALGPAGRPDAVVLAYGAAWEREELTETTSGDFDGV
ncbi:MAG: hypothetical protein GWM90_08740, partial [Gemmatimonadetes bacterium]|nr:hypothetical protein [Gemmatimonadota bacterium]NIQ53978.1 hypothetical protein [Gemmatimonadota bacterium]NIU74163.1 hypothetical protein [Gammaproteobacteria bacterium]NIX20196.1 hypothetical protein [Actinomycetota bacterium]NIX44197.1 hypothetical protein [Gemmatimonadota bacterium]